MPNLAEFILEYLNDTRILEDNFQMNNENIFVNTLKFFYHMEII